MTYDRKQVLFERNAQVAGWEAARCQLGLPGCWSDCFSLLITTPAGVLRHSVLQHSEGIHNYNTLSTGSPSSLHTQLPSPPQPIYPSVLLFLLSAHQVKSCWPVVTFESCYGIAPPNTCTGSDKNPYLLSPMSPLCTQAEQEGPAAGVEGI